MNALPSISIVIPTYNRSKLISRAIRSCLDQHPVPLEILVVDDASTDGTAAMLASAAFERVRVLIHQRNRGPGGARNSGAKAAAGDFLLMLDSDDELLPGALQRLGLRCRDAPREVGNLASACLRSEGGVSPRPVGPDPVVLGYEEFLRFGDRLEVSDWCNCIRKRVFEQIQYPEGRVLEGPFHLELARRFRFSFSPEASILVHDDAEDRLTSIHAGMHKSWSAIMEAAKDALPALRDTLLEHGPALRVHAPRTYQSYSRDCLSASALCGDRAASAACAFRIWRSLSARDLVKLGLGAASPRLLAMALAANSRRLAGERS